ncbi:MULTISPECIES: MaoC family dehydratase [unclassified Streptomyces]|uniref:MaoC family dehydratase n=1 Tax=unclassified Streptomyces TaxID=2593676 RepID=UPI001F0484FA|nr:MULTISPECIES: MaoC family dehydratase [unclassified Streptomyces]MCH0564856.1 MaoC family dehydratase [Streptomyces sp. MUM 2J]MCH0569870.1 MaoC family dehydratase [Streptomyces sp. MUM 136J]
MATRMHSPGELLDLVGKAMGTTGWQVVDQRQVNAFAAATGDHQWIHVDPERAKAGPFGTPVAHGFLTVSLIPAFLRETVVVEESTTMVNYGLNKVRFPAPVPVGSALRGRVDLIGARARPSGVEATFKITAELRGSDRPACVAEAVIVYG